MWNNQMYFLYSITCKNMGNGTPCICSNYLLPSQEFTVLTNPDKSSTFMSSHKDMIYKLQGQTYYASPLLLSQWGITYKDNERKFLLLHCHNFLLAALFLYITVYFRKWANVSATVFCYFWERKIEIHYLTNLCTYFELAAYVRQNLTDGRFPILNLIYLPNWKLEVLT